MILTLTRNPPSYFLKRDGGFYEPGDLQSPNNETSHSTISINAIELVIKPRCRLAEICMCYPKIAQMKSPARNRAGDRVV